jgi:putative Ca2+/H+ antiporter (TMEM165/GDT1 family)
VEGIGRMRRGDTWAGLLCIAIGLLTVWEANRYTIGSLGQMGPGFYPAVLGVLMAGIGVLIALTGGAEVVESDPLHAMPEGAEWRGRLCIVGGIVLFILCAERLGMVVATFLCVFVAALGDRQATLLTSAALAAGITTFGTLLFHVLLGVSLPLWP